MKRTLIRIFVAIVLCGFIISCSKDEQESAGCREEYTVVDTRANGYVPENIIINQSYGFHTITLDNWRNDNEIISVECLDPWTQVMSIDSYNGKVMINIMSSNNTGAWKTHRFKFTLKVFWSTSPLGPLFRQTTETLTVHQPYF